MPVFVSVFVAVNYQPVTKVRTNTRDPLCEPGWTANINLNGKQAKQFVFKLL